MSSAYPSRPHPAHHSRRKCQLERDNTVVVACSRSKEHTSSAPRETKATVPPKTVAFSCARESIRPIGSNAPSCKSRCTAHSESHTQTIEETSGIDQLQTGQVESAKRSLQNSQQFGQPPKNTPKSIQSQFGQNYDIKKVRNSSPPQQRS